MMRLPKVKVRTIRCIGLGLALLACGCEVQDVRHPPVSIEQYEQDRTQPNPYPTPTVLLHNLRRATDKDLGESERVGSVRLAGLLGQGDPEAQQQLSALRDDGTATEALRVAAAEALGGTGASLAVAGTNPPPAPGGISPPPPVPTVPGGTPTDDLSWMEQNLAQVSVGDILRRWAKEASATGVNEPRYRNLLEQKSGATWDQALRGLLNQAEASLAPLSLQLLAARQGQDRLRQGIAALQPANDAVAAMQLFLREFDYLPATAGELAACESLYRGHGKLFAQAGALCRRWRADDGYRFDLRDFHLLSRLAQDPFRRAVGRTELVLEISKALLGRSHVARHASGAAGRYGFSDRFEKHLDSLSLADLWTVRLLAEMLAQPQVRAAMAVMAERDRADTRSAWGGLIFYADPQPAIRIYPPDYGQGGDDLGHSPSQEILRDAADSLCRFVNHFERADNARRAGPTASELAAAHLGNYRGMILTGTGENTFCAHFYNPLGIVISLGQVTFR